jgi:hypothetical protein
VSREQSLEFLRQSLPELDDAAFEKLYRQAFLRALSGVLGYEARRGKGWDEVMDVLAAERERRARRPGLA